MKVITCHIEPDFDAIASAIATKLLYPDAKLVFPNLPKRSKKNFLIQSTIYSFADPKINVDIRDIDTLILVDTRKKNRIGEFAKIVDKVKVICFDHHPDGDINCSELHSAHTGSNTTQLILKLKGKNIKFSPDEATLFMLGIYEDTGKLQYTSTTKEDFEACAYLMQSGANLEIVANVLEESLEETDIYLLSELIKNSRIYENNNVSILLSFAQKAEFFEVADLVNKLLSIKKTNAAICIFRMHSRIFVIGRSINDKVDVKFILDVFGGGGHKKAASAVIKDLTVVEVLDKAVSAIKEYFLYITKAKDIMSTPAKCVDVSQDVKTCNEIMAKFGINSLVVLDENQLVGIISRPTLQRAMYHNYGNEPVGKFMVTDFIEVHENETLKQIKKIIIDQKQRIIPVVRSSQVIGVLTRTNILNLINQTEQRLSHKLIKFDLKLKNKLNGKLYDYFRLISELSQKKHMKAYAVGGMVRDLSLNLPLSDIDIVVEGNAVEFAKDFASAIKAKIIVHEEFKTASVVIDGDKIDFAMSRQEYYDEVSSGLPHVEESSLKLDLYRRDFTINTLAISLSDNFGELIDYFGGLKDIQDKKIRILHNLSFIEDPTRILRAMRFMLKFGFQLGQQTERLMKNALELGVLNTVSKNRLTAELNLIFKEEKVIEILRKINEYKIFKYLHKDFFLDENCFLLLENAKDFTKVCTLFCPVSFKVEYVYFTILRYCLRKKLDIITLLNINDEKLEKVFKEMQKINIYLSKKQKNPEIYFYLKPLILESIITAYAISKSTYTKENIVKYLRDLLKISALLSGKDLLALGFSQSPLIGTILKDVFKKQLDGQITEKQEAINYVKSKYLT